MNWLKVVPGLVSLHTGITRLCVLRTLCAFRKLSVAIMPLPTLPLEMILIIAEYLKTPSNISALILTCRMYHHALTSLLYRSVQLHEWRAVRRFSRTLIEEESLRLADMVKSFELGQPRGEQVTYKEWAELTSLAAGVLAQLSRLERLDCYWKGSVAALRSTLLNNVLTLKEVKWTFDVGYHGSETPLHSSIDIPPGTTFAALRVLHVSVDYQDPKFDVLVRQVIALSSNLQTLRLESRSGVPHPCMAKYLTLEDWTSLKDLSLTDCGTLTRDAIPKLNALTSISVSYMSQSEASGTNVVALGRFAAKHLPALKSVACPVKLLPLFFPAPSASSNVCARRVSSLSLSTTMFSSDTLSGGFENWVLPSRLHVHLTHISLRLPTVNLRKLAALLLPLKSLESLKLGIESDQTTEVGDTPLDVVMVQQTQLSYLHSDI